MDVDKNKEVPILTFRKLMSNYLSFGLESRIGLGK